MKRKFRLIIWGGVLGYLFLLILIGVLNILANNVGNYVFQEIVNFLNQNLLIILLIPISLFLGNIFELFKFPYKIVYPLFNAFGSILWIELIFRAIKLINVLVEKDVYSIFKPFYWPTMILIPLVILAVGYARIYKIYKEKYG